MTDTFATDPSLQVIRINDFSPGIIEWGRGFQPWLVAPYAPLGSATYAYRCVYKRGVGLVPLPARTFSKNITPAGTVVGSPVVPTMATAIKAYGGLVPTSRVLPQTEMFSDIVYVALNYQTDASNRQSEIHRLISGTSTDTVIWTLPVDPTTNVAHGFSMSLNRVLNSAGDTAVPAVVMAQSFKQVYRLAPDSFNYTGGSGPDISGDYTVCGGLESVHITLGHEFRILFFCTSIFSLGTSGQYVAYLDDLFYTDPPQSHTVYAPPAGNAPAFFDPEDYSSVGCAGSVSSGELVVIRQGQGAFLIDGDITEPTITKLPGVRGTGRLVQVGATTPAGMIYLSELDGAWVWNGSNTSAKISSQIPDDALQRTATLPSGAFNQFYQLDGVNAYNESWGQWCLFSHNWLYDTTLSSWWRIEDPGVVDLELFSRANQNNRVCWGVTGQGTIALHYFDLQTPCSTWTWLSNPLTPYLGAYTNIATVEILASNADPTNTATIQISGSSQTGYDSAPVTFSLPVSSTVRLNARLGYNSPDPRILVTAANSGGGPAPTLHEIALGTQRGAPTGRT